MTSAKDVAAYLTFEIKRRGGVLEQRDAADWILKRFGRDFISFVKVTDGYGRRIRKDVIREFTAMNPGIKFLRTNWNFRWELPGPRDPRHQGRTALP
jgi:hypothetical protein